MIYRWVEKFRKYETVQNLNSKCDDRLTHSGRRKKRTAKVIEMVRNSIEFSPKRSIRRRSQSLSLDRKISASTIRRILIDDLKSPLSFKWKNQLQNKRVLGNPETNGSCNETTTLRKCTVWAAISAKGITGPFFFEENDRAVTVTKDRYVQVLELFWEQLRVLYPSLLNYFWFQQDGASSHTSKFSRDWLKEHFGASVISLKTNFEWAPYSPDLNPPDFYLWGYLKDRVYSIKPRTISELKENIREEIRKIPNTVCKNVINNLVVRLKKCTELKGGDLEHLLQFIQY
ncbi:hypothetical protein LOD99_6234 [Oopsacas minuta]|uniref:Transposase n=1 Tax=Oopsacas minuta TaxID=111878 RepID=A0AAV7JNH9_9METZ|nr:hypothetical protein LOD99_6234 [Oopsacas minuta]